MLRPATPQDASLVTPWSLETPSNGFTSRLSKYPLLQTFVIEDTDGPLLYVPWHPILCIESVAARPGIAGRQYIEALLEAKQHTEQICREFKFSAIVTSSEYRPMIRTLRRHGYDNIAGIALRKEL